VTDESLMQLFVEKGYKVGSARVVADWQTGRSRGFGFVELAPEDDAAKAIQELNGLDMGGRALQVNEARPQEPRGRNERSGGGGGGGRGHSGGRPGHSGRRSY
jgi:RNA recognition motif-containing protein